MRFYKDCYFTTHIIYGVISNLCVGLHMYIHIIRDLNSLKHMTKLLEIIWLYQWAMDKIMDIFWNIFVIGPATINHVSANYTKLYFANIFLALNALPHCRRKPIKFCINSTFCCASIYICPSLSILLHYPTRGLLREELSLS